VRHRPHRLPTGRWLAAAFALASVAGCQAAMAGTGRNVTGLVGTAETRRLFGLSRDTIPIAARSREAGRAAATAQANLKGAGFVAEPICTMVFDAATSWLVYAEPCPAPSGAPRATDGDAFLQVSRDAREVLQVLLAPGGVELLRR
jgi:hypothetical protein